MILTKSEYELLRHLVRTCGYILPVCNHSYTFKEWSDEYRKTFDCIQNSKFAYCYMFLESISGTIIKKGNGYSVEVSWIDFPDRLRAFLGPKFI